jgi:hypothetical protein
VLSPLEKKFKYQYQPTYYQINLASIQIKVALEGLCTTS